MIFFKEIIYSDDFFKYLSVNGVIMINIYRIVCGWENRVYSIIVFGLIKYVF